jgi:putative NIF3 family GTP cyclohydrolase 1 type 2
VRTLVSGVTASLALIDAAIADGADAILVHHGLFWRGQDGRLTGWLACGHHATERYGAPAVAAHVAERFGLAHRFIDLENPA